MNFRPLHTGSGHRQTSPASFSVTPCLCLCCPPIYGTLSTPFLYKP